jgi:ribokinase
LARRSSHSPDIFVIGGASLDVLHLGKRTVTAAGGAGLYTALAARSAGAKVCLLAPRSDPLPDLLQPVVHRLTWIGPLVPPDQLPRLEVAHHGGGRATLIDASWGAVASLLPDALPSDLSGVSAAHVAALPTADHQLAFVQAVRARGVARISVGTYARLISTERDRVRAVFDAVDLFFMNENEASLLFGGVEAIRIRSGQIAFVTLGERGAFVIQEGQMAHVPGQPAVEVDPTGAGDTFCGAVLAGLARGDDVITAARTGVALAAEMIGDIGPAWLLAG